MSGHIGAIRAGRAYVEMSLNKKGIDSGLRGVQQRIMAFGRTLAIAGTALVGVGTAIMTPLLLAAKSFGQVGDTIAKMSARTGVSTEALSQLGFAAEQAGSDIRTLETGIRRMQRVINDANNGMASAVRSLDQIGLSVEDLAGMSTEDQFTKIAEAISNVEDASKKAALAQELFGRSGTMLLPLLSEGADGIAALRAEADALGLTMSAEDAKAAEEYSDAMNRLSRAVKAAWFNFGAAVAPPLTAFANVATVAFRGIANAFDKMLERMARAWEIFFDVVDIKGFAAWLITLGNDVPQWAADVMIDGVDTAFRAAVDAGRLDIPNIDDIEFPDMEDVAQSSIRNSQQQGTFSGEASRIFFSGNLDKEQLGALLQIERNTRQMRAASGIPVGA